MMHYVGKLDCGFALSAICATENSPRAILNILSSKYGFGHNNPT